MMSVRMLIPAMMMAIASFTPVQAAPAEAEAPASAHHHPRASATGAKTASTRAYLQAMQTMHRGMRTPLSGNVDVDFARQMMPHHQGALDMAEIQLRYGHDEELKRFNQWVIAAQTKEIGFMKNWLRRRDNGAAPAGASDYFAAAMQQMHHGMAITYTGDADVDYVRGMIAHHQGAVDMARVLLAQGTDPELNALANDVFSSQTYEIAWMQDWLKARGHMRCHQPANMPH